MTRFSEQVSGDSVLLAVAELSPPQKKPQPFEDWLKDFVLKQLEEKGACKPNPVYEDALKQASALYFDQSKVEALKKAPKPSDCDISTHEKAVDKANETLQALGDPYTHVLGRKEVEAFNKMVEGETLTGIGVSMTLRKSGDATYPVLSSVFPGTPAEKAGLEAGDILLQVDGQSLRNLPLDQAQALLRGQESSRAQIKFDREGVSKDVFVTRAKIEIPATLVQKIDDDVLYVRLIDFMNENTDDELAQALSANATSKALILDVRQNPGGMVDEMIETLALLMKDGKVFRQETKSENGLHKFDVLLNRFGVNIAGQLVDRPNVYMMGSRPIVLLIDEHSVSASELLAGALKDNQRAVLVGSKTFGKGVGQWVRPIADGAMLSVTGIRFENPSGFWPGDGFNNRKGIEPNITIAQAPTAIPLSKDDVQFQRALEEARKLIK